MKRAVLFFFFSIFITNSFAQTLYGTINNLRENLVMYGTYNPGISLNDINGSPYMNDEFITGSIFDTSKVEYAEIKLRYNIYNDEIEFELNDTIQVLSTPEIVGKIVFPNYTMNYIPYSISKQNKRGFFTLLEEGKASLYARSEVIFKEEVKAGAYKDAEPAEFVRKSDSYYIRIGTGISNLVSNKNDLIEVFPDNKDKIETFIKDNKIKPNKVEGLKRLVQYYNSL